MPDEAPVVDADASIVDAPVVPVEVTPISELPPTSVPVVTPALPTDKRPSVEDLMAETLKEAGVDPNTPLAELPVVDPATPVVDPTVDPTAVVPPVDPSAPVVDPAAVVEPVVPPVVEPVVPDATPDESAARADVLALLGDPANLDAALREAAAKGIENVTEIPIIKEMLRRVRQSEHDTLTAAVEKQAREVAATSEHIQAGVRAEADLLALMVQAEKDIKDGAPNIGIPTEETLKATTKAIRDAAVGQYHGHTWQTVADAFYELPEVTSAWEMSQSPDPSIRAIGEEQVRLLSEKDIQPEEYLRRHTTIARNNLWQMAQAAERNKQSSSWGDREKLLNASHAQELGKAKAETARLVDEAKQSARAQAFADLSKMGGTPPASAVIAAGKSQGGPPPEPARGATIGEIYAHEKRVAETSAA